MEKYEQKDVTSASQALDLMARFEPSSVLYAYSWHLIGNDASLNETERDYHALHTLMTVSETNGFLPLFEIQSWVVPRLRRVLDDLGATGLLELLCRAETVVGIPGDADETGVHDAALTFFDRGDADPSLWENLKAVDNALWTAKTDWTALQTAFLTAHTDKMG